MGVGALLLTAAVVVLAWLKHRAFAPLFSLADIMERFGRGDRDARATETGPLELQEMSRCFNEMASALAMQRQRQIAFLGGVAHDLRNPLSALKLSVASASPNRPLPPEPRLRQILEKIGRQIVRLERMTGDFLDMASIESGEMELNVEVHDAREMVRAVVDLHDGGAPDSRIRIALPAEPLLFECDPLRIEQVLTNLLSNAMKYSPPNTEIEVALEPLPGEVVLRVTDQGVGILEGERQSVFEPFRRVGLSKGAVPGVGLGLYVVRRIIEAHRGLIEVESVPGSGSTFRVFLPRRHFLEAGVADLPCEGDRTDCCRSRLL
jgi:signal transduction histidine kinase